MNDFELTVPDLYCLFVFADTCRISIWIITCIMQKLNLFDADIQHFNFVNYLKQQFNK